MTKNKIHNRLMQLFRDNVKQGGVGKVRAEVSGQEATIYLYDVIGDGWGVSARGFVQEMMALKGQVAKVHLRINSPGGDVFEARAMATGIQACGMEVVAHIDGVCASAATYVALACGEVVMAKGAFFMIHQAWSIGIGNSGDMRALADLLDKVDESIVNDYAKKTGKERDDIAALMAAVSWFTAAEALENKFVDSVCEGEEVENRWNLSAYENVPEKLANQINMSYDREQYERRLQLFDLLS